MTNKIDTSKWQCGDALVGDSKEDTILLREMYLRAESYIRSQKWSYPIKSMCLGYGIGGVIALFLCEFTIAISGSDDRLWVVVGDIPSAYFVTDEAQETAEALSLYCELMSDWADAVSTGGSLDEVFPVEAAPTFDNIVQLRDRISFIRTEIIPPLR